MDLSDKFVLNCSVSSNLIKGHKFFESVYPAVKLRDDSYAVVYNSKPVVGLNVINLVLDERGDSEVLINKLIKVVYDMPSSKSSALGCGSNPFRDLFREMECPIDKKLIPDGNKLRLTCDSMINDFFLVRDYWLSNFSRYL
ncbi:MAG TPA: hypothetical protein VI790_01115 [Candidatus Nanoarchaeia archaeon]|nr:hypothetical protein [Candidatus Nanoarchaeia archaeon]